MSSHSVRTTPRTRSHTPRAADCTRAAHRSSRPHCLTRVSLIRSRQAVRALLRRRPRRLRIPRPAQGAWVLPLIAHVHATDRCRPEARPTAHRHAGRAARRARAAAATASAPAAPRHRTWRWHRCDRRHADAQVSRERRPVQPTAARELRRDVCGARQPSSWCNGIRRRTTRRARVRVGATRRAPARRLEYL